MLIGLVGRNPLVLQPGSTGTNEPAGFASVARREPRAGRAALARCATTPRWRRRVFMFRYFWVALVALAVISAQASLAQPAAEPGYVLRAIDGDNDLGEHFAVVDRPGGATGFFYLADQGRLIASSCFGQSCSAAHSLSSALADRGRYVSAATRTALGGRPLAAYYDATNGDLMAFDCSNSACPNGFERTLESVGNVGQDTAIAIDPASGLALIGYYDVDNGDLRLYRCATTACDSGSSGLVDGTNDRGHNASMVFAGSTLWIAYEDRSSGELILARSSAPYTTFAFFSQAGGVEPSLTADASGFLDMVWRETSNNTLQRLRCLNATCTSANQITLAGAGRGYRPSSTRLANGNLLVSHFEPSTGSMLGSLCPDLACGTPQALSFNSSPANTGNSVMRISSTGLPLVFFQDAARADVRSTQCTTAACGAFTQHVALNGLPVHGARLALRPDGRAVVAYIRQRQPWLAQCNDVLCSSVTRSALPGGNSDARPAIAVRPDNRPFGYYSSVGGSAAYDCSNADCGSGSARAVSGEGNSTGNVIEMALRADGRPVLLYAVSNLNDVYVFDCADVNCSSGTQRLLADEPTGNNANLTHFAIVIGPGDRPIVMYALNSASGSLQRYVRCNDSACSAASVSSIGTNQVYYASPLALRSDGRPAFIESGLNNNYAVCDNADCTGVARFPVGISGIVRSLVLQTGDRPAFESGTTGLGSITSCDDATCSSAQQRTLLTDPNPQSSYQGSIALASSGALLVAFEEQSLGDVVLAVPLPDALFTNGFE